VPPGRSLVCAELPGSAPLHALRRAAARACRAPRTAAAMAVSLAAFRKWEQATHANYDSLNVVERDWPSSACRRAPACARLGAAQEPEAARAAPQVGLQDAHRARRARRAPVHVCSGARAPSLAAPPPPLPRALRRGRRAAARPAQTDVRRKRTSPPNALLVAKARMQQARRLSPAAAAAPSPGRRAPPRAPAALSRALCRAAAARGPVASREKGYQRQPGDPAPG